MGTEREGGFALPVTLLALIVLTALATAGFLGALVELRIAEAHVAAARAYEAARAGLETALGDGPDTTGTPRVLELAGGDSATIVALRLLALTGGRGLYLVRSDGAAGAAARGRARRSLQMVVLVAAGDTLPVDTLPGDTLPGDTLPGDTLPGDTLPGDTLPGDTLPGDTLPGDTPPGLPAEPSGVWELRGTRFELFPP